MMNKTIIIFSIIAVLLSVSVHAVDNRYAFSIELDRQGDQVTASLIELQQSGVSDLVDQNIKQELEYSYSLVGYTVYGVDYYKEYVLLDSRIFNGADPNCFVSDLEFPEEDVLQDNLFENELTTDPIEESIMRRKHIYYDSECGGMDSIVDDDATTTYVNVPYISTIRGIKVYDDSDNLVAELDLSEYADYCGDYMCSLTESYISCPTDCVEEQIPLLAEQIFRTENSEITANKDMSIYVIKDKCIEDEGTCVEIVERNIYARAQDNSIINIDNKNSYISYIENIEDESRVIVNEDGVASVTKNPLEVKGDWTKISDIHSSFTTQDGHICTYSFDSSTTQPVTVTC